MEKKMADSTSDAMAFDSQSTTVAHGPYAENLPVVGMSVAVVRDRFAERLDIDPKALPFVNGKPVDEDYEVRAGETLMFARRAGEKG